MHLHPGYFPAISSSDTKTVPSQSREKADAKLPQDSLLRPSNIVTSTTNLYAPLSLCWGPSLHIVPSDEATTLTSQNLNTSSSESPNQTRTRRRSHSDLMHEEVRYIEAVEHRSIRTMTLCELLTLAAQHGAKSLHSVIKSVQYRNGTMADVLEIREKSSLAANSAPENEPKSKSQTTDTSPSDALTTHLLSLFGEPCISSLSEIAQTQHTSTQAVKETLQSIASMSWISDSITIYELSSSYKCRKPSTTQCAHFLCVREEDSDEKPAVTTTTDCPSQRPNPPPGTPHNEPETSLEQSLSMPTLPTFYSVSDPVLVAKYQYLRSTDPATFDARTAVIKTWLTAAKIERGGSQSLTHGDYTVELASREDAAKVDRWQQRNRQRAESVGETFPAFEPAGEEVVSAKPAAEGNEEQTEVEPVKKYTSSGTLHRHRTRSVSTTNAGTTTTIYTRIEITQEKFVPRDQSLTRDDIQTAMKQVQTQIQHQTPSTGSSNDRTKPAEEEEDDETLTTLVQKMKMQQQQIHTHDAQPPAEAAVERLTAAVDELRPGRDSHHREQLLAVISEELGDVEKVAERD